MAIDTQLDRVMLQPTAAPVDTYVRPSEPDASPLDALAQSLGGLSSALSAKANEDKAQTDVDDEAKGELYYYEHPDQTNAAVKANLIPPQESPHFIAGLKHAQGANAMAGITTAWATTYQNWDGRNITDPVAATKAFDTLKQTFIQQQLGEQQDPLIAQGMKAGLNQWSIGAEAQFQTDLANRLHDTALSTFGAGVSNSIDAGDLHGLTQADGHAYDNTWANIMQQRGVAVKTQHDYDVDKTIVGTVIQKATLGHDEDMLGMLDNKEPGKDYAYSADPAYSDDINKARETIKGQTEKDIGEQEKQALATATLAAGDWMFANPGQPLPDELVAAVKKHDVLGGGGGNSITNLLSMQKAIAEGKSSEDPVALLKVREDIMAGGGTQAVMDGIKQGIVKGSAEDLWNFAKAQQSGDDPMLKGTIFDTAKAMIITRTRTGGVDDPAAQFFGGAGATSEAGAKAVTDYILALEDWRTRNPNASASDIAKAQKINFDLIDSGLPPETAPAATYRRPDELAQELGLPADQPAAPAPAAAASAASPPQRPALPTYFPNETPDQGTQRRTAWLSKIDPAQVQVMRSTADGQGLPFESYIDSLMAKLKDAPTVPVAPPKKLPSTVAGGPPAAPDAADTSVTNFLKNAPSAVWNWIKTYNPAAQGPLQSALGTAETPPTVAAPDQAAKAVGGLADVVTQGEAHSYSERFGGQQVAELTSMPVSAVADLPPNTANGLTSTAAGKYQFLSGTLKGLVRQMGLTGAEPFTPVLQDRMAVQLMVNRGLKDFLTGSLTAHDFANNLAQEWASVPNQDTGHSDYAGQGTGVAPEAVLQALAGLSGMPNELKQTLLSQIDSGEVSMEHSVGTMLMQKPFGVGMIDPNSSGGKAVFGHELQVYEQIIQGAGVPEAEQPAYIQRFGALLGVSPDDLKGILSDQHAATTESGSEDDHGSVPQAQGGGEDRSGGGDAAGQAPSDSPLPSSKDSGERRLTE